MKQKVERTRATVQIEAGGNTDAGRDLIGTIMQAIMNSGYLGSNIVELDRNDEAAEFTIEIVNGVYDDAGMPVYEEPPQPQPFGGINREPSSLWGNNNAAYPEQPQADTASPAPEDKDECTCFACQLRRSIMYGLDPSKLGSDRTGITVYRLGPKGLEKL